MKLQTGMWIMLVAIFLPAPLHTVSTTTVQKEIIRQAKFYGVSVTTSLRIANCESGFKDTAKNKHSTAKGIYQFIDGTWNWIGAKGHQYDYRENIRQFMRWYPKYPKWWECK